MTELPGKPQFKAEELLRGAKKLGRDILDREISDIHDLSSLHAAFPRMERSRRTALVECFAKVADYLNDHENVVVVLAARRAVVLWRLMCANGLVVKRPERVVSDRFLQLENPSHWWKAVLGSERPPDGYRIVCLDDTVLTGTREQLGVNKVCRVLGGYDVANGHVASVVPLRFAELAGVSENAPDDSREMDDAKKMSLRTHFELAKAFAAASIPLVADFPVSTVERVTEDLFLTLVRRKDSWRTISTTCAPAVDVLAQTYVLHPRGAFLAKIKERLGNSVPLVDVLKFKVFYCRGSLSIVPVVLPRVVKADSASDWAANQGIGLRTEDLGNDYTYNLNPQSEKHQPGRALALAAFIIARAVFKCLQEELGPDFSLVEDVEYTQLLLGPSLSKKVSDVFSEDLATSAASQTWIDRSNLDMTKPGTFVALDDVEARPEWDQPFVGPRLPEEHEGEYSAWTVQGDDCGTEELITSQAIPRERIDAISLEDILWPSGKSDPNPACVGMARGSVRGLALALEPLYDMGFVVPRPAVGVDASGAFAGRLCTQGEVHAPDDTNPALGIYCRKRVTALYDDEGTLTRAPYALRPAS